MIEQTAADSAADTNVRSGIGILLLSLVGIKKTDKDALGACLNKGCYEPKQAPVLPVPATAAVWAVHCAEGFGKGKARSMTERLDAVQTSVQEVGPSLFSAFDLVLSHDHGTRSEDYVDSILDRSARQGAAGVSSRGAGTTRDGTSKDLRQQIAQGASMAMPCVSSQAMATIQQYYALLRQQGGQQPGSVMDAGTRTVASLLRMATACARLHMRNDVILMPDAVLAIYLIQESMKAKVRCGLCLRVRDDDARTVLNLLYCQENKDCRLPRHQSCIAGCTDCRPA